MLALASCLRPLEHIVRIKTRTDAADPTKKTSRRLVGGIEYTCDGRGALLACRGRVVLGHEAAHLDLDAAQ